MPKIGCIIKNNDYTEQNLVVYKLTNICGHQITMVNMPINDLSLQIKFLYTLINDCECLTIVKQVKIALLH